MDIFNTTNNTNSHKKIFNIDNNNIDNNNIDNNNNNNNNNNNTDYFFILGICMILGSMLDTLTLSILFFLGLLIRNKRLPKILGEHYPREIFNSINVPYKWLYDIFNILPHNTMSKKN